MSSEEINLKVEEIPQQHVGAGRAIVDPKVLEDTNWSTGQILELTFHKKHMSSFGLDLQKNMGQELSA